MYLIGQGNVLAQNGYFSSFISDSGSVVFWFVLYSLLTLVVIYRGGQNGIEKVSSVMMHVLVILAIIIAIYCMSRPGALAGVAAWDRCFILYQSPWEFLLRLDYICEKIPVWKQAPCR